MYDLFYLLLIFIFHLHKDQFNTKFVPTIDVKKFIIKSMVPTLLLISSVPGNGRYT